MGLHPSVAAVRRAVRRGTDDLEAGTPVLVACSGGPDSMALLAATVFEGHRAGLRVVGASVDHGLQAGSAEVTARVVQQMARLGADETISARVQVEGAGLGPEAAARRARYTVLEQMASHVGAAAVLLGHTRDDQAETVLLGLARGSGGRSLAGMRRRFDRYRRPLLDVTRDDTVTACQVEGIEVWHDPHNDDPGYARVRVRRAVLPVLEEHLGPGVAATLARTADQLRVDMDLLDDLAERAYADVAPDDPAAGLPVDGLAALPDAVRRRVLRLAALAAGSPPSELFHDHVLALDALVTGWRGQKWVDLPGHVRGTRSAGVLRVAAHRRGDGPADTAQA
ncbi:tRNA lysidine(34) synthetase TilS [Nocardioides sp. dk4132]|uniref:tRNA lysidine(34) synthetase TilS n=1 Tax=unclassified Nocardioides TaxID=2615069 RepID=UPI001294B737|nr:MULTISPECIES: tRNA lysidine(34) synthetase TilS [unclassified Nocardioides]MQW74416.1 tRNA lysidine(34) synthetase TilS [Nocardioides sp. dk4132]QGA06355.1 tRNA lysidine(34) synthetase TilS [Nocardioides sp. dk884]